MGSWDCSFATIDGEESADMVTYITLYKWTEQGIKNVKDAPARILGSISAAEGMGGKVLGVYVTMGEYDLVAISEWPTEEAAAAAVLAQSVQGYVRTISMRAFNESEFAGVVKKLP
jgi:uncharacterized protein with GYD domain